MLLVTLGSPGARLASLAIVVSTLGFIGNRMLTVPRLYHAMAQDGLFFRSVASIDPRTRVPVVAIALQALVAIVIALTGSYEQILSYVVSTFYVFNGLSALALFVIRARDRSSGNARVGRVPRAMASRIDDDLSGRIVRRRDRHVYRLSSRGVLWVGDSAERDSGLLRMDALLAGEAYSLMLPAYLECSLDATHRCSPNALASLCPSDAAPLLARYDDLRISRPIASAPVDDVAVSRAAPDRRKRDAGFAWRRRHTARSARAPAEAIALRRGLREG